MSHHLRRAARDSSKKTHWHVSLAQILTRSALPVEILKQFKERFGARPLPLCALKQVYDPAAYEALCRAAGADPADLAPAAPGSK